LNLQNKTIWITGASSGIGEALAIELAKEKCSLILSARRKEELERVQKICLEYTTSCNIYTLDLSDIDSLDKAAEDVMNNFGPVQIMIHNGGISQRSAVAETNFSVDKRIMDVNFFSYVKLTKKILPSMIKNKEGHFVVISSVSGKFGFPLRSAYAASKHALHGFFDTLRFEEHANNIGVTIVCPGRIKTNISFHALEKDGKPHGKMDDGQEQGIAVDVCAKKIIRGVNNGKNEIYIGGKEILMVYIKRFFPGLFNWLVLKIKPT